MKIKLYRSSTVGIYLNNFSILFDPWLTDDEYFGSWSHIPPFDLDKYLNELNSYDFIYISHIHQDHCSESTLKLLNKNIPIFIHKFNSPFIKSKIERLGFTVNEIDHGKKFNFDQKTSISIYAADNCDPSLCYKFTSCAELGSSKTNQMDTFCVIEQNDKSILNLNDCPYELVSNFIDKISFRNQKIDLLLLGYSGAGPYPQCMLDLDENTMINEANKKKQKFLNQCFKFIDLIKPKYYLPFAGTYYLSGKLAKLNKYRGVADIDEAYDLLDELCVKNEIDSQPVKINYDSLYDFDKNPNHDYKKKDKNYINQYIKQNLANKLFSFEKINYNYSNDDIFKLANNAYIKMFDRMLMNNFKTKTKLIIKFKDYYIYLNLYKKDFNIYKVENYKLEMPYIIISLNNNLLYDLLRGPKYAHWNNAEIGSHLFFERKPNIYERGLHTSLSYFHN